MSDPSEKPTAGVGCLLRTYWMLAGNVRVAFLAIFIAQQKGDSYTFKDILYWLIIVITKMTFLLPFALRALYLVDHYGEAKT